MGGRRHLKNPVYLSLVKKRDDKTLQAWLKRFIKATVEVGHLSDDALLLVASSAVREDTSFAFLINKKPPQLYSDFLERARNYVNAEALTSKRLGVVKNSPGNPKRDRQKEKKRPTETPAGGSQQPCEDKRPRDLGSGIRGGLSL